MPSWRRGYRCPSVPPWWRCVTAGWQGFAVMRACQSTSRVGPLFAQFTDIAASLVAALADKTGANAVAIDVPDVNKSAVKLVEGSV